MLTATCATCRAPKSNYSDPECEDCLKTRGEMTASFREQFPTASESDMLYAIRRAMQEQRGAHPHSNYRDPKDFSADKRGM